MKKFILTAALLISTVAFSVGFFALAVSASEGKCGAEGSDVNWFFDENLGILSIDGDGRMKDYSKSSAPGESSAPWNGKYAEKIKIVSVGDGIEYVGKYSFYGCKNLTAVKLPSGITEIGDGIFYGCESLDRFELTDGITKIGENAFFGCSSLLSVKIPASVNSIGKNAFFGCGALAEIEVAQGNEKYRSESNCLIETASFTLLRGSVDGSIPESVKELGEGAFSGCGFSEAEIPKSVLKLGYGAFSGCKNLKSITVPFVGECRLTREGEPTIAPEADANDTPRGKYLDCLWYIFGDSGVPSSLTKVAVTDTEAIGAEAFAGCSAITSIVLPEGLVRIGDGAFYNCSGIETVQFPESLEVLGIAAFSGCSGLQDINIPNRVKTLGASLFLGCYKLKTIALGASVSAVGDGFLASCPSLEELSVSQENENYYSESNCIISRKARILVAGCKNSVIPKSVTAIGDGAFRNCNGLTELKIPESVTSIGDHAFFACVGLTSVEIPSSVTEIGAFAFAECRAVKKLTMSKGVKVGESAFANCVSLRSDSLYISENDTSNGVKGSIGLWIGIAIAVPLIVFGAVFATLLYKKRKNGDHE